MLSVCVLREHSIILLRGHSCDVIIVSLKKNAKKFERLSKRCNQLSASCRKQLIQIAINFESFIEHAAANKEKREKQKNKREKRRAGFQDGV